MAFTDLLTIAMPVYERKDFFENALQSALNQTVKCRIIVNDNNSSHNFFEKICREKGVEYFRNEKNIGIAGNFAKGFERSETPFVLNLQDDDQLEPEYVEAFVKAHEQHPDIDIFFSDFVRLTGEGKKPHKHTLPFGYMANGREIIEYGIKYYKLGFPYVASAIKKDAAKSLTKYDALGSYDWVWIYSEAENYSFYGDSRALYIFRDHDNQDTKNNSIKYNITIAYIYDQILKQKVADPRLKKIASRKAFWELVNIRAHSDKKTLDDFVQENKLYGQYFKNRIESGSTLKFIYSLPKGITWFGFKILNKLGFIQ